MPMDEADTSVNHLCSRCSECYQKKLLIALLNLEFLSLIFLTFSFPVMHKRKKIKLDYNGRIESAPKLL